MKRLPIGIYEKALPFKVDWHERLSIARQTGFDFVEISIDESDERQARLDWTAKERADLRHAIAENGVPIITMCLSGHRKYPYGSANAGIRQRAQEMMHKAIEFAADIGIRIIQLAGYYVYYEPHLASSRDRYRAGLSKALDVASQAGVMLALENVDGNDVMSVTEAMRFVNDFNSPWFQIYPDIGNLAEHELSISDELGLARGHIVGVHVKDTIPGEPRRVPFGEGVTPFEAAFRKLAEMNFNGPVLLEMWNDDSPDSLKIVEQSRIWVEERMIEGGLISAQENAYAAV
ncbi:MAG: L-ribulose-5-phosphate 3-epimerase [Ardenticatenaceae bacterium]|nr:L-ribulose-5-phosphate 3-epimerase [Ardenticatenaceae bacterium]MCB9442596.1 L-ribulose-5-phosphate 3-epimerase [Ardenticatenaceae bacterium]